MSRWKPGQLVTINGIVYRVRKAKVIGACIMCEFKHYEPDVYPCVNCMNFNVGLMQCDCYLEKIKPKS